PSLHDALPISSPLSRVKSIRRRGRSWRMATSIRSPFSRLWVAVQRARCPPRRISVAAPAVLRFSADAISESFASTTSFSFLQEVVTNVATISSGRSRRGVTEQTSERLGAESGGPSLPRAGQTVHRGPPSRHGVAGSTWMSSAGTSTFPAPDGLRVPFLRGAPMFYAHVTRPVLPILLGALVQIGRASCRERV